MRFWHIPIDIGLRQWRSAGIGLMCSVLMGCVTPVAVKQASTQHTTNLTALAAAAAQYRTMVRSYYDDLIAVQRDAYVAQQMNAKIKEIAENQYSSVNKLLKSKDSAALTRLPQALPDKASEDFIESAQEIREGQAFWIRNFQAWLDQYEGEDLAAKKASLKKKATDEATDQTVRNLLAKEAERDDRDLAYVAAALGLRKQATILDQKLDRLARQIKVMQAFHGVVDEYLSIDATIDAKAIAQAAAAGASLDLTGLPGLARALGAK